jgi:hypothetical protein
MARMRTQASGGLHRPAAHEKQSDVNRREGIPQGIERGTGALHESGYHCARSAWEMAMAGDGGGGVFIGTT